MVKGRRKWERRERAKITEDNVPELRIKNPTLDEYLYVATLAQQGTRSVPDQLRFILKDYKKLKAQEA